jgi:hypothetical protein
MDTQHQEYMERIKETQRLYFESHRKNTIFKNNQKKDCANFVSTELNLQQLVRMTAVVVPNTNIIYYNYLVFKTYGNEENHILIYKHVTDTIASILDKCGSFEFHINLKSFSISACQRYRHLIASSFDKNQIFTDKMTKLVVYNTPGFIDQITMMLYSSVKDILKKVEYVKSESDERISTLFNL